MEQIKIHISEKSGDVSALWSGDMKCKYTLVLGHGAGAGMKHPFLAQLSEALRKEAVGTLRYQFPYLERERKSPGSSVEAIQTILTVLEKAQQLTSLPILLGGKSYGGRMASLAVSKYQPETVRGLVFFGFPLHAPGKIGTERAQHLGEISVPLLFLQGEKDKLADMVLMKEICKNLPMATLVTFTEADHSFNRPKRTGHTLDETITQLALSTSEWAGKFVFM